MSRFNAALPPNGPCFGALDHEPHGDHGDFRLNRWFTASKHPAQIAATGRNVPRL